ncbi:hypothetical protein [Neobacillus drentensis]|uniref:hypothetical protein n=1 Tax=Neobacillus drentensis TaxID=220684 RepID=UPI000824ABAB|nr:hypothetical protein [Neobacillus drentensis]
MLFAKCLVYISEQRDSADFLVYSAKLDRDSADLLVYSAKLDRDSADLLVYSAKPDQAPIKMRFSAPNLAGFRQLSSLFRQTEPGFPRFLDLFRQTPISAATKKERKLASLFSYRYYADVENMYFL